MSVLNSHEVAPVFFECDLDRDQAGIPGIPPFYMLNVSGVLLAGKDMLIAAGDVSGAPEQMAGCRQFRRSSRWIASRILGRPTLRNLRAMANMSFGRSGLASFGRLSGPSR